jgi:hypothetical protein
MNPSMDNGLSWPQAFVLAVACFSMVCMFVAYVYFNSNRVLPPVLPSMQLSINQLMVLLDVSRGTLNAGRHPSTMITDLVILENNGLIKKIGDKTDAVDKAYDCTPDGVTFVKKARGVPI